eukprot:scaffold248426_cov23-Tisochrysis_lutea.AAC.1
MDCTDMAPALGIDGIPAWSEWATSALPRTSARRVLVSPAAPQVREPIGSRYALHHRITHASCPASRCAAGSGWARENSDSIAANRPVRPAHARSHAPSAPRCAATLHRICVPEGP